MNVWGELSAFACCGAGALLASLYCCASARSNHGDKPVFSAGLFLVRTLFSFALFSAILLWGNWVHFLSCISGYALVRAIVSMCRTTGKVKPIPERIVDEKSPNPDNKSLR